jgi:hypothetical protein
MESDNQPKVTWVPGSVYARVAGLHPQTLNNWRYRDKKAGRTEAPPGYPRYRRFGHAVRYLLEDPPREVRG